MRSTSHASRGQALYETVILVPLLLFSLVGILFSIRAAVQYERVEQAVRYSAMFQESTPYTDYSLESVYAGLGPTVATPPIVCASPIASQLSDGAPYAAISNLKIASPPLFTPSTVLLNSCGFFNRTNGIDGSSVGTQTTFTNSNNQQVLHTQVEDDVLAVRNPLITAQVNVPSYLQNALGAVTTITSSKEYFERGITVAELMYCYNPTTATSLNAQVTNTLKPTVYASPAAVVTPFPAATPPGISTVAKKPCTNNGPT